jgi:hypothetical protein
MTAVYMRNFDPVEDALVARQRRARDIMLDGANFPISGRAFPVGDLRYAFYYGYLPDYVSTPTLDLLWTQTGAQASGNVSWVSAVAAITPGDTTRFASKAFAASNSTSTSALDDQRLQKTTITVTNTDSLAAGDLMIVRINRDPSIVTCGGTAVLIAVSINYTGT